MSAIEKGKEVAMHFSICLSNGDVVDSTLGKSPAQFVIGDGNLLPGFEKPLLGLKAGDKRSVVITPDKGFGPHRDENIQKFKRNLFEKTMNLESLEPGVVVSFADAQNAELPGVIHAIEEEYVVVDFNHPLAGKELTFQVEVLSVQEPQAPVKFVD